MSKTTYYGITSVAYCGVFLEATDALNAAANNFGEMESASLKKWFAKKKKNGDTHIIQPTKSTPRVIFSYNIRESAPETRLTPRITT